MTPDIYRLQNHLEPLAEIVDYLELELTDNPRWELPSDISYLNERDLANPDIVGNVKAMLETNKLISWFGQDVEGYIGLWHGIEGRTVEQAQILRLDTEGQYHIVAATVPDYLAVSCDNDDFERIRTLLIAAGFSVAESIDAIWDSINATYNDANKYRHTLYNKERILRGAKPITY